MFSAQWLGAIREQDITWANVDQDLCCHMVSLSHNELTTPHHTISIQVTNLWCLHMIHNKVNHPKTDHPMCYTAMSMWQVTQRGFINGGVLTKYFSFETIHSNHKIWTYIPQKVNSKWQVAATYWSIWSGQLQQYHIYHDSEKWRVKITLWIHKG